MRKLLHGLGFLVVVVGIVAFKDGVRSAARSVIRATREALSSSDTTSAPTASAGAASDVAARVVARHATALTNSPELAAHLRGKTDAEAQRLGYELARKGTRRLDDESIGSIVDVRARLVASMDGAACAALAREDSTGRAAEALASALLTLDSATVDRYMAAVRKATVAELRLVPPRQVSDEQLTAAMAAVYQRLPDQDRPRFTSGYVGAQSASDADACWALRTLYSTWAKLPEPQKSVLALGLVEER
jgi:hypothetical protein